MSLRLASVLVLLACLRPTAQAPLPSPPSQARAVSYDAAWQADWLATIRAVQAQFPNKLIGKTLQFGDSLTFSQAYGYWPLQDNGQTGATASDLEAIRWAHFDIGDSRDGFRDAWDGVTADSGMSWFDWRFDANISVPEYYSRTADAQFAVMMCNVPDAGNPTNVDIVEQRIDQYLKIGIVPIPSTIPPRNDPVFDDLYGKPYNAALTALARRKKIPLIDLAAEFYATWPDGGWKTTLISEDGIHPSCGFAQGYGCGSDPYTPGGNPAIGQGGTALAYSGYLLRTWITIQKMKQIRALLQTPPPPPPSTLRIKLPALVPAPLVQQADLIYDGAFRVPAGRIGTCEYCGFGYGGNGLSYRADHDSLYMWGHPYGFTVAEIAIPTPVKGVTDINALPVATVKQGFAYPFMPGAWAQIGSASGIAPGGLLVDGDKMYVAVFSNYDAGGSVNLSHWATVSDLTKSSTSAVGPVAMQKPTFGTMPNGMGGYVSGYFGRIAPQWQAALGGKFIVGQSAIPIVSRTSDGPAAFVIDPAQIGPMNPVPAKVLVMYPIDHQTLGEWGAPGINTLFSGGASADGVVFPPGTRSALFFGRSGDGVWCYGEAVDCGDTAVGSKGNHAFPYHYRVWAYDVADLAASGRGEKMPWDVKPYAYWNLDLPFPQGNTELIGADMDFATGRIFVSQAHADGDNPLILVFHIQR